MNNPPFLGRTTPYIIAEIGGNHEGDFAYAQKLVELALSSKAHAIKFQSYYADKIVSVRASPERHAHFRKFELALERYFELQKQVTAGGAEFLTSLWDVATAVALNPILRIHKIGSGDLTNYLLLRHLAETGKPIILATAMSTLAEVKESVDFICKINPRLVEDQALAVLHCVALYGNPRDEYANLEAIRTLQGAFPDLPVGYSDHTMGISACQVAIGMGCSVIEKHFTDDKTRSFRDHHIAGTATEFLELVQFAERYTAMRGDGAKVPVAQVEDAARIRDFRRAVYMSCDAPAGTRLTEQNTTTLRPNVGIDARRYYEIQGRTLRVAKCANEPVLEVDLD